MRMPNERITRDNPCWRMLFVFTPSRLALQSSRVLLSATSLPPFPRRLPLWITFASLFLLLTSLPAYAQDMDAIMEQWLRQRPAFPATSANQRLERLFKQGLALFHNEKTLAARELFEQGYKQSANSPQRQYEFLAGRALCDVQMDHNEEALSQIKELIRRVPEVRHESDREILYSAAGWICFIIRDFGAAIENYRMAEGFSPKEGNVITATAGVGYANSLMCVGRFREAKKKLTYSLRIAHRLKENDLEQTITRFLGLAQIDLGEYQTVESQIVLAKVFAPTLEDKANLDISLGLLYWFQAFRGRSSNPMDQDTRSLFDKSRKSFESALSVYKGSGVRFEAFCQGGLALALCGLKQYDRALAEIKQAMRIMPDASSRDLALGYGIETLIHEGKGDLRAANETVNAMLRQLEEQEERIGDSLIVAAVQDIAPYPYSHAARLLLKQAEAEKNAEAVGHEASEPKLALMMAERGRGRGLTRFSIQGLLDSRLSAAEHNEWIAKSRQLAITQAAVRRVKARSEVALPKDRPSMEKALMTVSIEASAARKERDDMLLRLFAREPELERLMKDGFDARPGETAATQNALKTFADLDALTEREPDTLFLEYAIVDRDNALIFALSKQKGLRYFFLPFGDSRLTKLAHDWRVAILAAQPSDGLDKEERKKQTAHEPQIARQFYELLMEPLESNGLLTNVKRLVVVANGPLLSVPFAALQNGEGKRLFERFPIATSISLRVLMLPDNLRTPDRNTLFAVADSLGDTATPLDDPLRDGMGRLPFARMEGELLKINVPGSLVLIGNAATRAHVIQEMPRYVALHFAIHGTADAQNGLLSRLFLAPQSGQGSKADVLLAQDVMKMRLSARLAILSACESAQGEILGGEGLMGLAWCFLAAGCPSVIGSDWSIHDKTTELFMNAFYKELLRGARKDDALQSAMRTVQESGAEHRSPYYWAAFRLIGKTEPLRFGESALSAPMTP